MPVSSGRRHSPERRLQSDDDNDVKSERILTDSPPLPCINSVNQAPVPSWQSDVTDAGTSAAPGLGYPRVTADQASRPGALVSGVAAPNPSDMDMTSVPPPPQLDVDRGTEADTEDTSALLRHCLWGFCFVPLYTFTMCMCYQERMCSEN